MNHHFPDSIVVRNRRCPSLRWNKWYILGNLIFLCKMNWSESSVLPFEKQHTTVTTNYAKLFLLCPSRCGWGSFLLSPRAFPKNSFTENAQLFRFALVWPNCGLGVLGERECFGTGQQEFLRWFWWLGKVSLQTDSIGFKFWLNAETKQDWANICLGGWCFFLFL